MAIFPHSRITASTTGKTSLKVRSDISIPDGLKGYAFQAGDADPRCPVSLVRWSLERTRCQCGMAAAQKAAIQIDERRLEPTRQI